ncbi:MAG TPA: type II secretion system secretin GspD [Steroidobacteraceae bacterium]|nr:type II secretion system secretin GspD [Steroidobacteraceae bacterium]
MTPAVLQRARVAAFAALLTLAGAASAQQQGPRITPNFKDADITQIVEAVSAATGKNFIIDPRVGRQQVTMLSTTPMTPEAFYQAFLSILQVHGFVAMQTGDIIKIIPDANARQFPSNDLPDRVSSTSDEIVTQVIAVRNVSAAQLVPILRPLIPQYGHLAAYPASNMLIISDRANNVNRIVRIIRRIDQAGDAEIEVIPMQNASATEVVRVVTQLVQGAASAEGGAGVGASLKLVADDRSNSVLISGEQAARLRVKALIAHLDTPLESGGDTQVRYLRYSDAEKVASKLKEQITGVAAAAGGAAGATAGGAAAQAERNSTIWADPENNALVITAPPKTMRSLMGIIDKLDIRRAQVLVQAVIVEVRADKTAELGVNWAIDGSDDNFAVGSFVQPIAGGSIVDIIRGIDDPSTLTPGAITGTTIGGGRVGSGSTDFAAVLRAIRNDSDTNIIATPSIVTLDNQEAQIKVAQEVPFITGQYTNTGGTDGALNPFQTVQREEVGIILKITPQINEGSAVILKIEQEASTLSTSTASAVDLITNKRVINTTLLVEDGGTIVLGGLIQDEDRRGEQRVPFLGRIPLIGELFRVRQATRIKTNLMVFIQPKILRDGVQASFETDAKYNYIRGEQQGLGRKFEILPLLPGEKKAVLPELPPPVLREPDATDKTAEDLAREAAEPRPASPPPAAVPPATVPPETP